MLKLLFALFTIPCFAQASTPTDTISPTITPTATVIPTTISTPSPTPTIYLTLSNVPAQSIKDSQFSVTLTLNNAKPNTVYHFKAYISGSGLSIASGSNWISAYSGYWGEMPPATTDANGFATINVNLKQSVSGTISLIGKSVQDATSYTTTVGPANTPSQNIIIIDPSPTPTPSATPTPTPTSTPGPSNTPTPTSTPTATLTPTITPTPSKVPTDTPEPPLTPVLEPTSDISDPPVVETTTQPPSGGDALGLDTSVATKSSSTSGLANILPLIFIIGGGVLLATPLIISKIKIKWPAKK